MYICVYVHVYNTEKHVIHISHIQTRAYMNHGN